MVLQKFHDAKLYVKLEKCVFHQYQVNYIISGEGLFMDPKKIQTIMEWKKPKLVRDVQCFFDFANFNGLFIQDYSKIVALLIHLTYNDKLEWSAGANQAFQDFKISFTTTPILIHPHFFKPFFPKNDAPDYALGADLF
jgi:hypothetical protein